MFSHTVLVRPPLSSVLNPFCKVKIGPLPAALSVLVRPPLRVLACSNFLILSWDRTEQLPKVGKNIHERNNKYNKSRSLGKGKN